jgi:hypothetical protein
MYPYCHTEVVPLKYLRGDQLLTKAFGGLVGSVRTDVFGLGLQPYQLVNGLDNGASLIREVLCLFH